jgi:glycosyltransferase involved in cell wall biosynthesis
MKLCMIAYCVITHDEGKPRINDKFGYLLDSLSCNFDQIFFLAGSVSRKSYKTYYPNGKSLYTYEVKSDNISFKEIAASDSKLGIYHKFFALVLRTVPYAKYIRRSDFVYITMPGLSGFVAHLFCRFFRKPYCLYFGSDWQEVASYLTNWQSGPKFSYDLYLRLSEWSERIAVKGSEFTLVHGKKLWKKFKEYGVPVIETVPMVNIKEEHIYLRDDTCSKFPIQCLYVGAVIPRKGLHHLVRALKLILEQGIQVNLQIVGAADHDYGGQLRELTTKLDLENNVSFCGYITDLQLLLNFYRQADIFILPSFGEGFPRVIYEAMSQGLPVIASNIETIESVVANENQVVLFEPGNTRALVAAIERVITDGFLRRKVIRNGYQFIYGKLEEGEASEQLVNLITKGPQF